MIFTAGQCVKLTAGFSAAAGSDFLARILGGNIVQVRDYCSGVEYLDAQVEAIYYGNGRVKYDGTSSEREYILADYQGNNRVLFKDNGSGSAEEIEGYSYYPFGAIHNQQSDYQQKYLYSGKELQTELSISWLDFGARCLDVWKCRWETIDPLANAYSEFTPYSFVANNPIRYIDPDGMKIGDGKNHFNRFKKEAENKVKNLQQKATNLRTKATQFKADGKEKKAKRLEKRADKNDASAKDYQEVVNELNTLESSDQVYNLYTNSKDVSSTAGGNVQFDINTGALNVNVKGSYNSGAFAHELKHAFQFETGKLSFGKGGKVGGALYDIQDEVEAYKRGSMFGWPNNPSITKIKKDYPSIKDRMIQRTLSTPAASFSTSVTLGKQMRGANISSNRAGKPLKHYYKGYKKELEK